MNKGINCCFHKNVNVGVIEVKFHCCKLERCTELCL